MSLYLGLSWLRWGCEVCCGSGGCGCCVFVVEVGGGGGGGLEVLKLGLKVGVLEFQGIDFGLERLDQLGTFLRCVG
jgi:hypothetical protein